MNIYEFLLCIGAASVGYWQFKVHASSLSLSSLVRSEEQKRALLKEKQLTRRLEREIELEETIAPLAHEQRVQEQQQALQTRNELFQQLRNKKLQQYTALGASASGSTSPENKDFQLPDIQVPDAQVSMVTPEPPTEPLKTNHKKSPTSGIPIKTPAPPAPKGSSATVNIHIDSAATAAKTLNNLDPTQSFQGHASSYEQDLGSLYYGNKMLEEINAELNAPKNQFDYQLERDFYMNFLNGIGCGVEFVAWASHNHRDDWDMHQHVQYFMNGSSRREKFGKVTVPAFNATRNFSLDH